MNAFGLNRPEAACVLAALAMVAGGCTAPQSGGTSPATATATPLRVAAASDLQTALPKLGTHFTSVKSIPVVFSFGASGQLAEQIKGGAPFDVFLSADQKFVKDLAAENLIVGDTVRPYAQGTLVLAVHRGSEKDKGIETLADLSKKTIKKVALANPAFAPYGAAGKQALERSNLWASVSSRIVQAESVRQALLFVQSGNAEVGLVSKAIADVPEVRVIDVDSKLYDPIVQSLGVVAASKNLEVARAFAEFVVSAEGQEMLQEFGFAKVGSAR